MPSQVGAVPLLGGRLGASEGRAGIRMPGRQRGALRALPAAAAWVPRGAVLAERPAGTRGAGACAGAEG